MAVKFCYGVGIDMLRGRITLNTIYFRNYLGDKAFSSGGTKFVLA